MFSSNRGIKNNLGKWFWKLYDISTVSLSSCLSVFFSFCYFAVCLQHPPSLTQTTSNKRLEQRKRCPRQGSRKGRGQLCMSGPFREPLPRLQGVQERCSLELPRMGNPLASHPSTQLISGPAPRRSQDLPAQLPLEQGWPRGVPPSQLQDGWRREGLLRGSCVEELCCHRFEASRFLHKGPHTFITYWASQLCSQPGSDPGGSRAVWA